jgi:hypothetical protein
VANADAVLVTAFAFSRTPMSATISLVLPDESQLPSGTHASMSATFGEDGRAKAINVSLVFAKGTRFGGTVTTIAQLWDLLSTVDDMSKVKAT